MARTLEWRRSFGVGLPASNTVAGIRTEWAFIADIAPGETVTRTIADLHFWRQSTIANDTEARYTNPLIVGMVVLNNAFVTPPINPMDDPDNQSWYWWEFAHWSLQHAVVFNDDNYQSAYVRFDTPAQRLGASGGTVASHATVVVDQVDAGVGTNFWNTSWGISTAVLLPEA